MLDHAGLPFWKLLVSVESGVDSVPLLRTLQSRILVHRFGKPIPNVQMPRNWLWCFCTAMVCIVFHAYLVGSIDVCCFPVWLSLQSNVVFRSKTLCIVDVKVW